MKFDVEDQLVKRLRKASRLCGFTLRTSIERALTEFCENREYIYSVEGLRRFPYITRKKGQCRQRT